MPLHQERRILPYTVDQMYAVVADIERYPEFLPWCAKVVIFERERKAEVECITAEMLIAYHGLRQRYTSRVTLDPKECLIEARHIQGPFRRLDTSWRFVPLGKNTEVHFLIDFAFKNAVLSAVAGAAFGFVASRMAEAFVQRAHALYGSKELSE